MSRTSSELSVAFLDVLSCSLGGMILLFLIFSTFSHQGSRSSRSKEGLVEPTIHLQPSADLGSEEINTPVLIEVRLLGVNGGQGTLAFEPPLADPEEAWASISQDESKQTATQTVWFVFVEDTAEAENQQLQITPTDQAFLVATRSVTSLQSSLQEAVIVKANAGQPRLRFANGGLTAPPAVIEQ